MYHAVEGEDLVAEYYRYLKEGGKGFVIGLSHDHLIGSPITWRDNMMDDLGGGFTLCLCRKQPVESC